MRENAASKGRRYLCEGRLHVETVHPHGVAATCRGDGVRYQLGWQPGPGWWCTCPVLTDQCAHLIALRLVVAVDLVEVTP
jgi:uncharacterized Zn finger protein